MGLVDTLPEIPQMSLLFGVNIFPKYMCVSSCSHYLPFEVYEFPIARHTHPCIAMQWTLSDRHGIMDWYRIRHGLVLEISGYLFKSVIFHKSN